MSVPSYFLLIFTQFLLLWPFEVDNTHPSVYAALDCTFGNHYHFLGINECFLVFLDIITKTDASGQKATEAD